jgi:hypothetical protein
MENGACVEVALHPTSVIVRDSKAPDSDRLSFAGPTWLTFISRIKSGELDFRSDAG